MFISLAGKKFLLNGCTGLLGEAIVTHMLNFGANIICCDILENKAKVDAMMTTRKTVQSLLLEPSDWDNNEKQIKALPSIDGLVNNVGVLVFEDFLNVDETGFNNCFNKNVKYVWNVTQAAVSNIIASKKPGVVINISSAIAKYAVPRNSLYCSSKAALDELGVVMALELASNQIRVNTVAVTAILTEYTLQKSKNKEFAQEKLKTIPLRRFGELHEAANAVVYMLSDYSKHLNGITISVDGGFLSSK